MQIDQLTTIHRNLCIDSLILAIGALQRSLLHTADKMDKLSLESAEIKRMAVLIANEVNPATLFLEQIRTGKTPKSLIFIDTDGKACNLLTGYSLSGQEAIDNILDNVKIPVK